jgi:hypothetical protein
VEFYREFHDIKLDDVLMREYESFVLNEISLPRLLSFQSR